MLSAGACLLHNTCIDGLENGRSGVYILPTNRSLVTSTWIRRSRLSKKTQDRKGRSQLLRRANLRACCYSEWENPNRYHGGNSHIHAPPTEQQNSSKKAQSSEDPQYYLRINQTRPPTARTKPDRPESKKSSSHLPYSQQGNTNPVYINLYHIFISGIFPGQSNLIRR